MARGKKTAYDWLVAHRDYAGDDCLIWPFSTRGNGYGQFGSGGGQASATRVMCELAHGPTPTPQHDAAHSCGRGHLACVHPKHLAWKTPAENAADRVAHGTATRKGGKRFKLTRDKVDQIRALGETKSQFELADMFGVTFQNIGLILRGEAWPETRRPTRPLPPDRRPIIAHRAYEMRKAGSTYEAIARELTITRLTARRLIEEVAASRVGITELPT